MTNTNVKATRAPRTPRTPKAKPEVVEPKPEVVETEPEIKEPVTPEPEPVVAPEPEPEPVKTGVTPEPEVLEPKPEDDPLPKEPFCTNVYLVKKGEKYNIFRGEKRLTRILVSLDKALLIAAGYGEKNPTIK